MKFTKNLSNSESRYKYVGLSKEAREEFPEADKGFNLKFKNKKYKVWVNNKNCFMISKLYSAYQFKEGDQINVKKIDDMNFELSVS